MKYKALASYWSCSFGDGVSHTWTIDKEYLFDIDDETQIVSFESDAGAAAAPLDMFNLDLLKDVFGIVIESEPSNESESLNESEEQSISELTLS